jgi:hypothetical protein
MACGGMLLAMARIAPSSARHAAFNYHIFDELYF